MTGVFIWCLAFLKVYQEPLTAALNSNRAILSYADIHLVLSPVTQLLELNRYTHTHTHLYDAVLFVMISVRGVCFRGFQADLHGRLQRWGAEQCVGDVLVELCSKLRVYTNYLNNYTTALRTVDKVRAAGARAHARCRVHGGLSTLCFSLISVQGDEASVPGIPEEGRQNSGHTHAEVMTPRSLFCLRGNCHPSYSFMNLWCAPVKPAGAAAVSGVENTGVRDSASGVVFTHTQRPPRPHTPVLGPRHPAGVQRVHTEGTTEASANVGRSIPEFGAFSVS